MNKVLLKGNLTKDPELATTNNGISVTRFSIAVQRKFANADGEREVDFINCVAWRNTADFVFKYFKKGQQILVCGALQTRTYEANDGSKRYATEVIVDEVDFCGKQETKQETNQKKIDKAVEVMGFTPIEDSDLPF